MIVTTDLHFTDKPEDRYRFKIFTWVHELFKKTGDKNLLILGDLTDAKDHHSSNLVNSITKRMLDLTAAGMEIFILKGNHDYIDPEYPFFEFLGRFEYINFIKHPKCILIEGKQCLFLPHSRQPEQEWEADKVVQKYRTTAKLVFCHESVLGSVTSSGYEMRQGLLPSYFRKFKGRVFSGDIHCPQKLGKVTYVGTPYSIRFNDHYRGRVLRLTTDCYNKTSLVATPMYPDIRGRWTLDVTSVDDMLNQLTELNWRADDQLKIRIRLAEADESEWSSIKKRMEMQCENLSLEICSLQVARPQRLPLRGKKKKAILEKEDEPTKVISRFAEKRGISKAKRNAGQTIVEN